MSKNDIIGLVLSYLYAFGLLFFFEWLGKKFRWSFFFTRKLIHIGAGLWVWAIIFIFDHWYYGIIPFATFNVLNYLFYKKQSFTQMDNVDSTPGTVYFAASITLLFLLFWRTDSPADKLPVALAATMSMTFGDALAALIGRYFGKLKYTFWKHTRSLEGSLAFFIFSFAAVFLTLRLSFLYSLNPSFLLLPTHKLFFLSAAASLAAASVEAISPRGTDNLTVPLTAACVLYLLF
jgi:phytol kinase